MRLSRAADLRRQVSTAARWMTLREIVLPDKRGELGGG